MTTATLARKLDRLEAAAGRFWGFRDDLLLALEELGYEALALSAERTGVPVAVALTWACEDSAEDLELFAGRMPEEVIETARGYLADGIPAEVREWMWRLGLPPARGEDATLSA